ncbi:hypothetical protein X759_34165 [Mesorhizobium sp. LSHC420B00]|uniref:hypothetical protein n=1 Tax=Mesorhizobium sp. LSHC420B00 TaxID=1287292 RepID=UPI0003CE1A2E|nr:hypothetical protein [Mesorhizobium sp. LSHC420B00]ESX62752.1 hypothetical protein X759_34165 [Mesorhizobium sp. LSHC420B00]
MEIRDFVAKISAALRKRQAAIPVTTKPIRSSVADVPFKPLQRPAYRPRPPIRPASNM